MQKKWTNQSVNKRGGRLAEGGAWPVAPTKLVGQYCQTKGQWNDETNSLSHKCPPLPPSLSAPRTSQTNPAQKYLTELTSLGHPVPLSVLCHSIQEHSRLVETLSTMVMEKSCSWTKRTNVYKHGNPSSPGAFSTHRGFRVSWSPPCWPGLCRLSHTGVVRRFAVLVWLESFKSFWMQLWTCRKLWSLSEL